MEHNYSADPSLQYLDADLSCEEIQARTENIQDNLNFNNNNNAGVRIKAIGLKALGTRLPEEERRNRLVSLPDFVWDQIELNTRSEYYFYIDIHADLFIRPTKNIVKEPENRMKILPNFPDNDERGTFFKVKQESISAAQYSFEFYNQYDTSVERNPVKVLTVFMKKENNNGAAKEGNGRKSKKRKIEDESYHVRRSGFPAKKGPVIDQTALIQQVGMKLYEKHVLILHGISGVGKSTLASEYGYLRLDQGLYQFAVWIDCKNETTMMRGFTRIAKFLNIPEQEEDRTQAVIDTLQTSNCLVVYDNCNEDMVDIVFDSFFPSDPDPCHVILTTQLPQSKWIIEKMEVSHMTIENYPDQAILRYILGVLGVAEDPTQETLTAANDVIKEYKSFTLLMSLIPQYIRMEDLTLPDFVRMYRDQFAILAPLNVKREDIPLKMIIDSLNLKCKMFLRLLSFMNSLANTHFFTDSPFFVEDQLSNIKFSNLKQGVAKLKNLSLIEFWDDGKAVKIGHEWIEHYLTRSTTNNDIQMIFEQWDSLFNGLIHMERAKYEICDVFEVILKYIPHDNEAMKIKFLNTVTDYLVNWTSPKLPRLYVNIIRDLPNLSLPQFIIRGVLHNDEDKLRRVIESYLEDNTEDNLHMIIASFYYGRMLSVKGQFNESFVHFERCQRYILTYLSKSHMFCQCVYREYAIALYHAGQYELAEQVLTSHHELRVLDDTKIYLGLVKFQLGYVHEAWTVLREDIFGHIGDRRRYDFPYSQQHGLATLLQCELLVGTPFPSILYQTDTQYEYPMVLQLAQAFHHRFRDGFQSWQIEVNQQAVTFGCCSNEPYQQLVAVACQGRMLILYRMQRLDHWCVIYTHDFIWPQNIIIP